MMGREGVRTKKSGTGKERNPVAEPVCNFRCLEKAKLKSQAG